MPDTLVSVIVPTVGRASLDATLASLRAQKRAHLLELILVADTRVTGTVIDWPDLDGPWLYQRYAHWAPESAWGHPQRNDAMARCRGLYIASLDDDDVWDPDALERLYRAALAAPDRPLMFRMRYGDGSELWRRRAVDQGNVGTPMFVVPNLPEKLGRWGHRYEGDLDFFTSTLSQWPADALVWRPEVLAHIRPGGTP
jgi:glycosyltransferase involved in cell wall biosynthesis